MASRRRIRLVHWKAEEVPERAARLEAAGYAVDGEVPGTSIGVKALREDPPDAFVIDLARLPSHGREVAHSLRQSKALRAIPIVFVAGAAQKVAKIRAELPDAAYADWDGIGAALREAIASPPANPVVPKSSSGPGSGRSLVQKLGIKEGTTIAVLDAPEGIDATIGPLPDGVVLYHGNPGRGSDMTIWFTVFRVQLEQRFAAIADVVGEGTLWMAWPKRSSGVETDISEDVVREVALPAGWVDTKVCAIDDTWSGLRLTLRRS
jgi:CheY-like chemotaxis protein